MNTPTQYNAKRRQVLKSVAGVAAVSAYGWVGSTMAMAGSCSATGNDARDVKSALPCFNKVIHRHQTGCTETINIINTTSRPVILHKFSTHGLSTPRGSLGVTVTLPPTPVTLRPNDTLAMAIEVKTANAGWNLGENPIPNVIAGQIQVNSSDPAFDGMIPVIVFDAIPV